MYDPLMVKPMREEAVNIGFIELMTPQEVKEELSKEGTTFVFVNSVCGCAAGQARPGLALAVEWAKKNNAMSDRMVTVFAGMEKDAVQAAREYFNGEAPTSPQIAMLKDGKLAGIIQRFEIENNDANAVAQKVARLLNDNCKVES